MGHPLTAAGILATHILTEVIPRKFPVWTWRHGRPEMRARVYEGAMRAFPPGSKINEATDSLQPEGRSEHPGGLPGKGDIYPHGAEGSKAVAVFSHGNGLITRVEIFDDISEVYLRRGSPGAAASGEK